MLKGIVEYHVEGRRKGESGGRLGNGEMSQEGKLENEAVLQDIQSRLIVFYEDCSGDKYRTKVKIGE